MPEAGTTESSVLFFVRVAEALHIAHEAKVTDAHVALVPSYGFGGHNRCITVTPAP